MLMSTSVNVIASNDVITKQVKDPIEKALTYFESIQNVDGGFPFAKGKDSSLTMTSWVLIALGAAEQNVKSSRWTVKGNNPIDYLNQCTEKIEETTEYARLGLALNAVGEKPIYRGVNVIDQLISFQEDNGAFYQTDINETGMINAHMWSILAIASDERAIPNVKKAKAWLLDQQNADGGFGWVVGAESDTDDTAIAIQALLALGEKS